MKTYRPFVLTTISAMLVLTSPTLGQDSDAALRKAIQDPPAEFRPLIITHGRMVTDPKALDWLVSLRAGGTVLDGGVKSPGSNSDEPWNDPTYLNDPKIFQRLREVISELRDRNRFVWIYDELGYPSGSAAGRVLQGHPEYQVWAVGCRDFEAVDGSVEVEVQHEHVEACLALPRHDGQRLLKEAIDLTAQARSGSFNWKTPKGDWSVYLFERYQPDTWRRHNIPRRNVNIMDRGAISRFIQLTHERYAKELGDQLENVTLFFTDEPQFGATEPWMYGEKDAVPAVQWCDELPDLTGKQGVFTESYAVAGNATLRPVLGIAAWQFATGVTHMSTYTIQNQLSAGDYAAFADFAGRLALLCRRGRPVSDVAVLVPEASVWAAYNPPDGGLFPRYLERNPTAARIDHVFRETCHQLLAHQRDFEILSEHLLGKATIAEGRLELAGHRFAFLVLPEMRMLHDATLNKARVFLDAGGYVAFVGSLPSQNPERGESAATTQAAKTLLASAHKRTYHVAELEHLGELVGWMSDRVPPALHWQGPSSVRIMRRKALDRDIVLVANPSAEDAEGRLSTAFGGEVSLWHPETGAVVSVGKRTSGQAVTVRVPADSAQFVIWQR